VARRRYRDDGDGDFDASLYGAKVRALIDEHVTALDIATKIPPVSITSPDFLAKVKELPSEKAQASEMEHALRFHIRANFDEDPARFTKLSERLDEILKTLAGKWDQLALALEQLLRDASQEHAADRVHADVLVARFYGSLEAEFSSGSDLPDEVRLRLLEAATQVVDAILEQAAIVRFWQNALAQDNLLRTIIHILDDQDDLFPFDEQPAVADRLMEQARANRAVISQRIEKERGEQ
jgi:type I restriction enzyme R subunit